MVFSDFDVSLKMRDLIARIAKSVVMMERPAYRYGTVTSIDYVSMTCNVQLTGDPAPVTVKMGLSCVPTRPGVIVRVEGIGTDKFITDVYGDYRQPRIIPWQSEAGLKAAAEQIKPTRDNPLIAVRTPSGGSGLSGSTGHDIVMTTNGTNWSQVQTFARASYSWNYPELQNGWNRYSTLYAPAQYAKTSEGIVIIQGLVKGGPAGTSVVFQLPEGYRPSRRFLFKAMTYTSKEARVDVKADGTVEVQAAVTDWISLENISFPAADVAPEEAWTPLTLVRSAAYVGNAEYGVPGYWQDGLSRVWLGGLIVSDGGTYVDGTQLATLSESLAPEQQLHFAVRGQNAAAANGSASAGVHVKLVTGATEIGWKPGSPTSASQYISLAGVRWAPAGVGLWYDMPYAAGASAYSSGFSGAKYGMFDDGFWLMRGLVKTTDTTGSPILVTRVENRWAKDSHLWAGVGGNVLHRLDIRNGDIRLTEPGTVPSWISLDNLHYVPES